MVSCVRDALYASLIGTLFCNSIFVFTVACVRGSAVRLSDVTCTNFGGVCGRGR